MNYELRIKSEKKNTLFIDTSDNTKTHVRLEKDGQVFEEIADKEETRTQITLVLIKKLLKKTNIKLEDIDHVFIKKGPGSYTGLRVGVSIANALSFSLGIPVNEKEVGEIEIPQY